MQQTKLSCPEFKPFDEVDLSQKYANNASIILHQN